MYAFFKVEQLSSLTIPVSVQSFGQSAFSSSPNLVSIIWNSKNPPTDCNEQTSLEVSEYTFVHVPEDYTGGDTWCDIPVKKVL